MNDHQTPSESVSSAGGKLPGRSIGAILVDSGLLTPENAERIMRLQKEKGLRFGDAAIELRLLKQEDIDDAISRQFEYPYLRKGQSSVSTELIAAYNPFDAQVEALRALRSQLMLRWFGVEADRKVLAIGSSGRSEGRSFLAANLAVVFSQLGERTLLIDADMRNPRQHELFGLKNGSGLSSILSGRGENPVQRVPALLGLSVLPAGPKAPNPQELLGRPAFTQLLEELAPEYDVILIDTPAGDAYADVQTVAVRAGAAMLIARKHLSHVSALRVLSEQLAQSGVAVVGSVLNEF
ncbi:chain length determinant protein tyrosine kinase EpsG [Herbaspirillum aquaticum]|jgi:receptor protein-tyrosine kinase|uniref:Chain length determinant protein tyrosine kinase EpsG n=1 Tax=Herbaspirillum aquaticum TaxID=568783 RepID=A0A225SY17_9BURK|nr:chain length determinant protein tyrosine kinase EpsG [Herbaspirillum aquaticum]OWY36152.1 chain length determinant protein tyrosine kinase EpsG [Herbaspirillum aquaticum]